jgi:hypothetical protein
LRPRRRVARAVAIRRVFKAVTIWRRPLPPRCIEMDVARVEMQALEKLRRHLVMFKAAAISRSGVLRGARELQYALNDRPADAEPADNDGRGL